MEKVELFGAWPSPFSYKVIWALKLKGIPYKYVEEDLSNKSPLLLQYNPVHKKIPIRVHGGKPICESTIILEYVEEMWPGNPLLPKDQYDRAVARFWCKFAEDKGLIIWTMFRSIGKEHDKATQETLEILEIIDEQALGNGKFFNGDAVGLTDLAFGAIFLWLEVIEQVVGVKLLKVNSFPRIDAWMKNFKEVAIIAENLPGYNEMVVYFKNQRKIFFAA